MEKQTGVTILNVFKVKKIPGSEAATMLTSENDIELLLRYTNDCALVAHTPSDLINTLSAAVTTHSSMTLTIDTQKRYKSDEAPHPCACVHLYVRVV